MSLNVSDPIKVRSHSLLRSWATWPSSVICLRRGFPLLTAKLVRIQQIRFACGKPRLAATVKSLAFVSTDAAHPEFMRPMADAQLKIPATPDYAGALPPQQPTPDTPNAAGNL